ncbi:MAG: hypothetical protein HYZ27_09875 [Deltaproteobacteria bacterium]|nr:hypothetical protein [Deltaproteobacteria bacterium]
MRVLCQVAVLPLILSAVPAAWSQGESAPIAEDHSAARVDSEVWGWSKDYSEMAVIGSEIRRGRLAELRGEVYLWVFPAGSSVPKHNVRLRVVTEAAMPHAPMPIPDVREQDWALGFSYPKKWPQRPKKKPFKGAMTVSTVWERAESEPGTCQPAVGFLLRQRGETRYLLHQALGLRAPCDFLRLTDTRTYWATKDLAAVMIRFDYSPTQNEASVRFPIAVSWKLARQLKLAVETSTPEDKATEGVRKVLAAYGGVEVKTGDEHGGWEVLAQPDCLYLAYRVAAEIGGRVVEGSPPKEIDLVVRAAPLVPRADERQPIEAPQCAGLLRDCSP